MDKNIFFRSHRKKIVTGAPIIFLLLIGSTGILSGANTLTLRGDGHVFATIGDEIPVTLELNTRTAINATGGTVIFPPQLLSVDTITRTSSIIDLWSEEPVISNTEGSVRFSGGIVGPHVNAEGNHGPVFILNMRAIAEGKATLRIKDGELLANDGSGSNQISSTGVLNLYVRSAGKPSPDINDDGVLSISDVNSLYIKTFREYDAVYDLNGDEKVDWTDVRLLISLL